MSITNLYASEDWDKVYSAFEQISFVSYDYDTVKEALLNYMRLYYKESFNDFIESSELITYVELFAYIAEQLAYRVDIASHENFITTAERKQSVLRLAKLVSYTASRNVPARGLVKIQTISTTETVYDSQGNNLSGVPIIWADPNNAQWKEQFYLVINRVMNGNFGQPQKVSQVGDIVFQLYSFNNIATTLSKGVFSYSIASASQTLPMEIVPSDLDENGPFERSPDPASSMSLLYADDGLGDSSDLTGFMLFTKQGNLLRTSASFISQVPNQNIVVNINNLNQTDVWVQRVDKNTGALIENWALTETINAQNLYFSTNKERNKFEVETLESDRLKIIFGDGNFSNIPAGDFVIWTRQSENSNAVIQKSSVNNENMVLNYISSIGIRETVNVTFSLTSALQNASASEDIEHIRHTAPTTYYSQGRMVNGQDYNTFLLRDPSILRLKTVNRTFAGQPKYLDWNDASGNYENIKLFGDDLSITHWFRQNSLTTSTSPRKLVDDVLEPLLSTPGLQNVMLQMINTLLPGITTLPRSKFIENVKLKPVSAAGIQSALQEKTKLQGLLDRHWYGEPTSFIQLNGKTYAVVSDDVDGKIWQPDIPTTVDGITEFQRYAGLQSLSDLPAFGMHFDPAFKSIGNGVISNIALGAYDASSKLFNETFTIQTTNDISKLSVTGSVQGRLPDASVGILYTYTFEQGSISFQIDQGSVLLIRGDSFILDLVTTVDSISGDLITATLEERLFNLTINPNPGSLPLSTPWHRINLLGQWSQIPGNLLDSTIGVFDPNTPPGVVRDSSWLIRVERNNDSLGNITSFTVTYRDLKLIVTSPTTKFWYNNSATIVDSDSKQIVRDKILILKSNLNATKTRALGVNDSYDVVGDVRDSQGTVDLNSLEVVTSSSVFNDNTVSANPLQFEKFAANNFIYFINSGIPSIIEEIDFASIPVQFNYGATSVYDTYSTDANPIFYTRALRRGTNGDELDFMWQHFSPHTNLIDPSPSNIHDAFILTSGYYAALRDYLEDKTDIVPVEPTPLDLRNSYGNLLKSKMLSDTVILHPAKIKLLFGKTASDELRAKFKVVKNPSGTLTNDQIRAEVLNVINSYFDIANWDFGTTFYATELISLIHQRLPLDVASAVIVPIFSKNSFGSLFTIEAGTAEILQSSAMLQDIEMVDFLSSTVLRQGSL